MIRNNFFCTMYTHDFSNFPMKYLTDFSVNSILVIQNLKKISEAIFKVITRSLKTNKT